MKEGICWLIDNVSRTAYDYCSKKTRGYLKPYGHDCGYFDHIEIGTKNGKIHWFQKPKTYQPGKTCDKANHLGIGIETEIKLFLNVSPIIVIQMFINEFQNFGKTFSLPYSLNEYKLLDDLELSFMRYDYQIKWIAYLKNRMENYPEIELNESIGGYLLRKPCLNSRGN